MFYQARIKLTAWYLVIIMVISVLFSIIIYNGVNSELVRFDLEQRNRQARIEQIFGSLPIPPNLPQYNPEVITNARQRFILILGAINVGILVVAGGAGYFLAGRTLRPIAQMIDEQHRFISDASHELRTPLTALRSEIEVYLRDEDLTLPEAKKLLVSNLEEVGNLQSLSDNLLQLSQLQMKQKHVSAVAVSAVVDASIKKISPFAKKKHISFESFVHDERVMGEEISLGQLLMILLDNGVKYSPSNTTITIAAKKLDQMVQVSVKDQGTGIKEKDIPHIFERFYRADMSRGKKVEGYGLGLSIAKKIVTEHNGKIRVTSTPEKGTTFTILLPTA